MEAAIKVTADAVFKKILDPAVNECTNKKCRWNLMANYRERQFQCKLKYISINKDGKCNEFEEI